ncbi:protein NEDD1-like [Lissotriton helveticus]
MQGCIRFVTAGEDIKIWDYSSMTVVEQFNPHNSISGISSLCWSTYNDVLASAAESGDKIVISSCKSKPLVLFELGKGEKQTCLDLHSSCKFLVSGGLDNSVNVWALKARSLHSSLKAHKDEVTCVKFTENDDYFASGSMSGDIIVQSVYTNLSSAPFGHGGTQPIRHLQYKRKKHLLGSVSGCGTVTLWDVNTQDCSHTFEDAHKASAAHICFSPIHDHLLVSVGSDKRICFYDTTKKDLLKIMNAESPLTAVDFMPDGNGLTIGSICGKIYQYDLRNLPCLINTAVAHKSSVRSIQFQHGCTLGKANRTSRRSSLNKRYSFDNSGKSQTASADYDSFASAGDFTWCPPAKDSDTTNVNQELTGVYNRAVLDICANESDYPKGGDSKTKKEYWRNSLGDVFSPVRDGVGFAASLDLTPSKEKANTKRANGNIKKEFLRCSLGDAVSPVTGPKIMNSVTARPANSVSKNIADTIKRERSTFLKSIQMNFIKDTIQEATKVTREAFHQDMFYLQEEMLKQFHMQLTDIHILLEAYTADVCSLLSETEILQKKNRKLRTILFSI